VSQANHARDAAKPRWGAEEILERADELTELAITLWPAPLSDAARVVRRHDWPLLHQALTALPRAPGQGLTAQDLIALAEPSEPSSTRDRPLDGADRFRTQLADANPPAVVMVIDELTMWWCQQTGGRLEYGAVTITSRCWRRCWRWMPSWSKIGRGCC
jgi:hypothetical protein